jgi:hypothetical protein
VGGIAVEDQVASEGHSVVSEAVASLWAERLMLVVVAASAIVVKMMLSVVGAVLLA